MKNIPEYSDAVLIELIVKSGQTNYFEILYDRYAHFVYNMCYGFVKEKEEAKDLTQDIFIKIFVNLPKFKGNSKLSSWIYSITLHTNINYIRENKNKTVFLSDDDLLNSFFIKNEDAEQSDAELLDINYEKLQQILNVLQNDDKMLLLMKYQDNLSVNQIIEILNIKESAVKMRLLRAKKKVMQLKINLELALKKTV